jgi:hypothetical protein
MWVHYAAQHRGFAIGFNTTSDPVKSQQRELRKVLYTNSPRLLTDEDPSIDACCYKSEEWKYEREWRCVQQFKPGESREIHLEPKSINEIIVGSKMTGEHIVDILTGVRLLETAAEERHSVSVFRSKPMWNSWSFSHEPLNQQLCDQCEGNGYISTGPQFIKA